MLELSPDLPILNGFQADHAFPQAFNFIPINFRDRRSGRNGRLRVLGQSEYPETVGNLLAIAEIIRFKVEIDFAIAQLKDGAGPDICQSWYPLQCKLERKGG
ncbi:MAG: hypothetical protein ABI684_09465, partial [Nitrospirota bacterium]